jgi:hypothetical protein
LIYKIEIENFCSIKTRQVIDLSASASLSDPDKRLGEIYPGSDRRKSLHPLARMHREKRPF